MSKREKEVWKKMWSLRDLKLYCGIIHFLRGFSGRNSDKIKKEKLMGLSLFFFKDFIFSPFSPQSPPVHSYIFFVVGPSSCGMWDAASAWSDE